MLPHRQHHLPQCRAQGGQGAPHGQSQLHPLHRRQQAGGPHLLGQGQHPQGVPRRYGAHAHLVLVVALGGAGEDAGRHGQLEGLGSPGGDPDLHRLEAVVDHAPLAAGAGEVARQAAVELDVHQLGQLAIEQIGQVGHRRLHAVHGHGDVAAIEVAAVHHMLPLSVDEGVVIGAVEFVFDELAPPGQAVGHHPDDVGGAAQGVSVLQPVAVAGQLARHQIRPQPGRDPLHAGMGLGRKQPLVEVEGIAPHGDADQGGDPGRQLHQVFGAGIGEAGQRRHHRGAVHQRQPLFWPQHQGGDAEGVIDLGRAGQLAIPIEFALPHQHGGHVGERGKIATGADRALFGDAGDEILLQQPAEPGQQGRAHPGYSLGQGAEPGRQHGAPRLQAQVFPQATAVKTGQVQGQLGHQGRGHGPGHRVAIASGHPIDDPLVCQQSVEKIGAPLDAGGEGGIRVELGAGAAPGQGHHLLYGEGAGAEGDLVQAVMGLAGRGGITVHHELAARNRRS